MHPYYQAILDAYAKAGRPYFHQGTPDEAREMMRTSLLSAKPPVGLPDLAEVLDDSIKGPNGAIPVRRYLPHGEVIGTALYFHSGGWVLGTLDHCDPVCRRLSALAGCELVSVDYRLAPEHPWPQPFDDAWTALLDTAQTRLGPLVLVGESAGGNLAAACSIRARDEDGPSIEGVVLAYPVTDCELDTDSYREIGPRNLLISDADMRWYWDHYCPAGVDRSNPLISPLKVADARALPPAFIRVAELDPLRDEGLAYADRLSASGVAVDVACDVGVLHGYWSAAGVVEASTNAVEQAGAWMRTHLRSASKPALSDDGAADVARAGSA